MECFGIKITTSLEVRRIERGEDSDLFVQILDSPVDLEIDDRQFSRIQFPKVKALILRLSPKSQVVTCHVLRDVDLFSSFANFEAVLKEKEILIKQNEDHITLKFK